MIWGRLRIFLVAFSLYEGLGAVFDDSDCRAGSRACWMNHVWDLVAADTPQTKHSTVHPCDSTDQSFLPRGFPFFAPTVTSIASHGLS